MPAPLPPAAAGATESRAGGRRRWRWYVLAAALLVAAAVLAFMLKHQRPEAAPAPAEPAAHETATAPAPDLPVLELSAGQRAALGELFVLADKLGASLADDNLQGFNQVAPQLGPAVARLRDALPGDHPWRPLLDTVQANAALQTAGDLAGARQQFLPFSAALVSFVEVVRRQDTGSAGVKIYRCPMAPKPGLWMQLQGPLRNPYYGEEMLECGVEVKR